MQQPRLRLISLRKVWLAPRYTKTSLVERSFYEATTQMSDFSPCKSLTLHLLSLGKKDCVYVDEIYVFADPADSTGLESQASTSKNFAGSSLTWPCLCLLFCNYLKQGVFNETKDSEIFGSEASLSTGVASKIETDTKPSIHNHQEVKFQDVKSDTIGSTQLLIPLQVPVTGRKYDAAYPPCMFLFRSTPEQWKVPSDEDVLGLWATSS